ncbi:MAG: hypothetical protein IPJ19_21080 [Planctomycetes bacterium]|nr:hypothetical protein [Planctomycetota bacterium]
MIRNVCTSILLLCFLALAAPLAPAQAPKVGDWYTESSDLGFKVRVPADYELVPPDPNEGNLIAKFDPKTVKYVLVGGSENLFLHVWLLRFDTKTKSKDKDDGKKLDIKQRSKDVLSFLKREIAEASGAKEESKKAVEINKIPATEYEYSALLGAEEVRIFATVFKLNPETEVAWVAIGPGGKKWSKFSQPFQQMAKSFQRVEVKDVSTALAADASYRDKRRAELQADMAKLNGVWKLYETPRYFIISDNTDKAFLDELKMRLEAIRDVYEKDYPYEKMQEIKAAAAAAHTGDVDPEKEAQKKAEKEFDKALNGGIDPREASKASIVRVCKDRQEYASYGGPGGSAGYWSSMAKELVLYDDKADGGRGDTWAVLNHEGFHQYIYYLYGNLAPHSWYNEGTGDFYSGFQRQRNGQFKLEKFAWRKDLIAEAIQQGHTVPLKEFTKFTQPEYYSSNEKYGSNIGIHYAQGWSFIYFLRTGKQNHAKGWNDDWDKILSVYFNELGATENLDQAVNKAFDGVDWDALENAWKDYTK